MARFVEDFQINADFSAVHAAIDQYLQSEGYEYTQYDNENVFKKGKGIACGPSFFKFTYFPGMVRMETWMKYALLPGVYVGEIDVDSSLGAAVKGPWKERIRVVENILANFSMQTAACPPNPAQNPDVAFGNPTAQIFPDTGSAETMQIMEAVAAESSASVFCTNCGAKMTEDIALCPICGQRRPEQSVQGAFSQNPVPAQQDFSQGNPYAYAEGPAFPAGYQVSRKEFIEKYTQNSLRKDITGVAILCYVCAGINLISAFLLNPIGIIDSLLLAGLALGMHLAKSKVCAILILVLGIVEFVLSLIAGGFPYLWLIAGITAVVTFSKIDKQYKQFLNGNG